MFIIECMGMCAKGKSDFLCKNCAFLLQVYYIYLHYLPVTAQSLKETLFLAGWQWSPCFYEHLCTSVALIELRSEVVLFYSHFSFIFPQPQNIAQFKMARERGWSPEYLHQTHTCLFIPPSLARNTQLRWCKIRNESINVSTFPSV